MGMEAIFYKTKSEAKEKEVNYFREDYPDEDYVKQFQFEKFGYLCGHWHLNEELEDIFADRCGEFVKDEHNLDIHLIELRLHDIDYLKGYLQSDKFTPQDIFAEYTEQDVEKDRQDALSILKQAEELLAEGYRIFYDASY